MYDTIRRLALELRQDALTDRHLKIHARAAKETGDELQTEVERDTELKTSVKALRRR